MTTKASLLSIFELLSGRRDADGKALGPRREMTRQRIVEAATEQLLEQGYQRMRVDAVATGASVTRHTLYSYFASKEHLLIAAMSEEAMSQIAEIAPLFDPERAAEERLRDWLRGTILYVVTAPLTARIARDRDPEVMRILMEHELARTVLGMDAELDKATLFAGLIQEAFADAFSDVERREIASLMRALSHMAPVLLDEHALFGLSVERMAEWLSELLVDGMGARLSTQGSLHP